MEGVPFRMIGSNHAWGGGVPFYDSRNTCMKDNCFGMISGPHA